MKLANPTIRPIAALFVGLTLAQAAAANLVVNGDFETPAVPTSPGYVCFSNSIDSGWTSAGTHGSCYIAQNTGPFGPAYEGSQYMYVNDYAIAGTVLSQSLSLVGGTTYRLTFAQGGAPVTDPSAGLAVQFGSASLAIDPRDASWKVFSLTYTPSLSGTELLSFSSTTAGAVTLDAVSVVAVPEPASVAMLLMGLLGVGAIARRARAN